MSGAHTSIASSLLALSQENTAKKKVGRVLPRLETAVTQQAVLLACSPLLKPLAALFSFSAIDSFHLSGPIWAF